MKNLTTKASFAISACRNSNKRLTVHQYFTAVLLQVWWQRQKNANEGTPPRANSRVQDTVKLKSLLSEEKQQLHLINARSNLRRQVCL